MIMTVKIDVEIPDATSVVEAREIVESHFGNDLGQLADEWGIPGTAAIYTLPTEYEGWQSEAS